LRVVLVFGLDIDSTISGNYCFQLWLINSTINPIERSKIKAPSMQLVGDEKPVEILPNAFGPDNSISLPYRVHRTSEGLDTAWLKQLDDPAVLND
jgi:hypothetical protein